MTGRELWPDMEDTLRFESSGPPFFDEIMTDARRELLAWANTPEGPWRSVGAAPGARST